jgi:hypothetical protein
MNYLANEGRYAEMPYNVAALKQPTFTQEELDLIDQILMG